MTTVDKMHLMSPLERVLIWFYVLPLAFDFRGEAGGGYLQYVLTALSFFSGISFILLEYFVNSNRRKEKSGVGSILVIWWVFLLSSLFVALINSVPLERYGRVILPFLFCGISIFIVHKSVKRNIHPKEIIYPLIISAAVSVVWIFMIQVFWYDSEADTARYRLVSVMFPVVLGYIFSTQLVGGKVSTLIIVIAICTISIVIVALTRGAAISILAVIVSFLYLLRRYNLTTKSTRAFEFFRWLPRLIVMVTISIGIAAAINPEVLGDWYKRLAEEKTRGGVQVTAVTRAAEYSGQIDAWLSSPGNVLLGRGLGSQYEWDWTFLGPVSRYLPKGDRRDITQHWFAGHGVYIYSFYSSGLLFGWIVPAAFLFSLLFSFKAARNPKFLKGSDIERFIPFPFLILMGFIPYSIVANPFWIRLGGLTLGIIFALSFWFANDIGNAAKIHMKTSDKES